MILEFLFQSGMKNALIYMYMTVIVSLKHVKTLGILSFFFFCILACVLEKLLLWNGVILILNEKKIRVYKTLNRVTKYYDSKGNKLSERYSTVQITTPKKSQEISGEILIHF